MSDALLTVRIPAAWLESEDLAETKYSRMEVMLYLLRAWQSRCTYDQSENNLISFQNGEIRTSLTGLSTRFNWSRTKLQKFLNALERSGKLTLRVDALGIALTIHDCCGNVGSLTSVKAPDAQQNGTEKTAITAPGFLGQFSTAAPLSNIYLDKTSIDQNKPLSSRDLIPSLQSSHLDCSVSSKPSSSTKEEGGVGETEKNRVAPPRGFGGCVPVDADNLVWMKPGEDEALAAEMGDLWFDAILTELTDYAKLFPSRFKKYSDHAQVMRVWKRRYVNQGRNVFIHPQQGLGIFYNSEISRVARAGGGVRC